MQFYIKMLNIFSHLLFYRTVLLSHPLLYRDSKSQPPQATRQNIIERLVTRALRLDGLTKVVYIGSFRFGICQLFFHNLEDKVCVHISMIYQEFSKQRKSIYIQVKVETCQTISQQPRMQSSTYRIRLVYCIVFDCFVL